MADLAHKEKTATLTPLKRRLAQEEAGKRPLPSPVMQRASAKPISGQTAVSTPQSSLQRMLANRQIQAKLTLGPVGDKYEQEADAVAKQVVGSLSAAKTTDGEPSAQRQEEEDELQMKPTAVLQRQEEEEELQMKPLVQRQEDEEELQAKGDSMMTGGELSGEVETAVTQAKSGGQPLAENVRAPMEHAFNADFSGVKIHTGSTADTLNRSLSARAFTSGQDVFFRSGEYNPGGSAGQELLAHELTHVVQQTGGKRGQIQAKGTAVPLGDSLAGHNPIVQRGKSLEKRGDKHRRMEMAKKAIPILKDKVGSNLKGHLFEAKPAKGGAVKKDDPSGLHAYDGGSLPSGIEVLETQGSTGKVHGIKWHWKGFEQQKKSTMFPSWMPADHVNALIALKDKSVTEQLPGLGISSDKVLTYIQRGQEIEVKSKGDTTFPSRSDLDSWINS